MHSDNPTCPNPKTNTNHRIAPNTPLRPQQLWWYNAAPHPAQIMRLDAKSDADAADPNAATAAETLVATIAPNARRSVMALHGDLFRARAIRPGHPADRQLLLEHEVGAVVLKKCECPQPEFVDCSKPPFTGPRWDAIENPVVFANRADEPLDLFYWNGTCEELVSWKDIGGMQPNRLDEYLSTPGHTFRARSAASRRMLTQYTLGDLVIRSCSDEGALQGGGSDMSSLELASLRLESERDYLHEKLSDEVATLLHALRSAIGNASSPVAAAYDTEFRGRDGVARAVFTAKGHSFI